MEFKTHPARMHAALSVREVVWCGLVVLAGFAVGFASIRGSTAAGAAPSFYQQEFRPALMQACGRGFVDFVITPDTQAAVDFLAASPAAFQSDVPFDCRSLTAAQTRRPNAMQRVSRYMMASVAVLWRLGGLTWKATAPLFGVLSAATALAAFLLVRAYVRPALACLATLLYISAPAYLGYLPHLRDFSKAPFVIGCLAAGSWMVGRPITGRRLVLLAAVSGVCQGLGLGFRMDLLIIGAVVVLAIALAEPTGTKKWQAKLLALIALAGGFVGSGLPILRATADGNNGYHVILLGQTRPFDVALDVSAPVYSWSHFYHDWYQTALIEDFAERVQGEPKPRFATPAYDGASRALFLAQVLTFPGDFVRRAYSSIEQVLETPFVPGLVGPAWITSSSAGVSWRETFFLRRSMWSSRLAGTGLWWTAALLVLVTRRDLRRGVWLAGCIAFVAGLPALQFNIRHYFHLEILTWLAIAATVDDSWSGLRWLATRNLPRPDRPALTWADERRRVLRAFAWLLVLVLAASGLLTVARWCQQRSATALIQRIEGRPLRQIAGEWEVAPDTDLVRLRLSAGRNAVGPSPVGYIAVVLRGGCAFRELPLWLGYAASDPAGDFSEAFVVRAASNGPSRFYFPVVWSLNGVSTEVTLEAATLVLPCVENVSHVDLGDLPMVPYLQLTPGWKDAKLYQHRTFTPADAEGAQKETAWSEPIRSNRSASVLYLGVLPATVEPAFGLPSYVSPIATPEGEGWNLSGQPASTYAYLLQSAPSARRRDDLLLAEGVLREGGLTIGLLKNERWAVQLSVTQRGPFRVALFVPEDGEYRVLIAAEQPSPSARLSSGLRRVGWAVPSAATRPSP